MHSASSAPSASRSRRSSSSASASSAPAPRFLAVKEEEEDYDDPPCKRSSRDIVINEPRGPRPSPPRFVWPKKEPEWEPPQDTAATQRALWDNDDPEEFPGQVMAMRAYFEEVPPASLEFALAWCKAEAEMEERERARRLGLLVDDNDDIVEVPHPSFRVGDAGQGSSRDRRASGDQGGSRAP
jgi:hypothetical protein